MQLLFRLARFTFTGLLVVLLAQTEAHAADARPAIRFGGAEVSNELSPSERVWPRSGGLRATPAWREGPSQLPSLPAPWQSFALTDPWALSANATASVGPPSATLRGWIPSLLLLGVFAGLQLGVDAPNDPRWSSRNSFDDGARDAFKGDSRSTREDADLASDILLAGMGGMLIGDWWWLRGEYGFFRSVQVDTRWWLANAIVTRSLKVSAGRERPYVRPCVKDGDYISSCDDGRDDNSGFFSGHASNSSLIAGTLCARHLNRRSPGVADMLVCGGAAAAAITTGVLRMTAEKHFMTDVLAGWAVGLVFGYFLPSYFDYGDTKPGPLSFAAITPVVGRDYYGVRYGFRF
jgi:membrane-associated phospholipid phosphatase